MIAKIVRITPDGAAFTTANGTFYPFNVGLDNGQSGQANSKSNPPPWRVGEVVGYTVTGQTPRGVDKLKFQRNPDASFGEYVPPIPQDTSNPDFEASTGGEQPRGTPAFIPPLNPPQAARIAQERPSVLPHGATVGGGLARAVEIWLAINAQNPAWGPEAVTEIEQIARDLVEVQGRIERGESSNVPF